MKKFLVISALLFLSAIAYFFYHQRQRQLQLASNIGWVPTNRPKPAFEPGAIVDERNPAEYEISVLAPDAADTLNVGASTKLPFEITVKFADSAEESGIIPPTFVSLIVAQGNKPLYNTEAMKPSRKTGRSFDYSGLLTVPGKIGDYEILIEAEHANFRKEGWQEPLRKTIKGVHLHVR
jgi:hypothetical protein